MEITRRNRQPLEQRVNDYIYDNELIQKHLVPDESGIISLDRVWTREHGIQVWAIADAYNRQPNGVKDKSIAVSWQLQLPQEAVEAGLTYYRRYQREIDARLLLNNAYDGQAIDAAQMKQANTILERAAGQFDFLFTNDIDAYLSNPSPDEFIKTVR